MIRVPIVGRRRRRRPSDSDDRQEEDEDDYDEDDDTPREWSMLELNGELVPPSEVPPPAPSKGGEGGTTTEPSGMDVDDDDDDAAGEGTTRKRRREKEEKESKASTSTAGGGRMELGSLRFEREGSTPLLTCGAHELTGSFEELRQPFVVLRKKKVKQSKEADRCMADGGKLEGKQRRCVSVEYEVAGVIDKKILFERYPKSLMR